MPRMTAVIEAERLIKTFGAARALDGLDLSVSAGEVHGFLGPNGAGKSTTIRILLGLMRSSGGRVSVFDTDPWADAAAIHSRLAYVPGDVALWPNLTGGETIDLLAGLRGGADPTLREQRGGHVAFAGEDDLQRCAEIRVAFQTALRPSTPLSPHYRRR